MNLKFQGCHIYSNFEYSRLNGNPDWRSSTWFFIFMVKNFKKWNLFFRVPKKGMSGFPYLRRDQWEFYKNHIFITTVFLLFNPCKCRFWQFNALYPSAVCHVTINITIEDIWSKQVHPYIRHKFLRITYKTRGSLCTTWPGTAAASQGRSRRSSGRWNAVPRPLERPKHVSSQLNHLKWEKECRRIKLVGILFCDVLLEGRVFSKVDWSGSVLLLWKKEILVFQLGYLEPNSTETSFPRKIPALPTLFYTQRQLYAKRGSAGKPRKTIRQETREQIQDTRGLVLFLFPLFLRQQAEHNVVTGVVLKFIFGAARDPTDTWFSIPCCIDRERERLG